MRLGLNLGYWGADAARVVDVARHAESLGFHSVWTAEAYGSDSVVPLTWVGAQTSTIGLGTAIMQMPARTPAMTAMTAVTLDLLSGGRALLGLGLSGPQVVEGWHGQPYGKPLVKTREYVDIVRTIIRREAPLSPTPGSNVMAVLGRIADANCEKAVLRGASGVCSKPPRVIAAAHHNQQQ